MFTPGRKEIPVFMDVAAIEKHAKAGLWKHTFVVFFG